MIFNGNEQELISLRRQNEILTDKVDNLEGLLFDVCEKLDIEFYDGEPLPELEAWWKQYQSDLKQKKEEEVKRRKLVLGLSLSMEIRSLVADIETITKLGGVVPQKKHDEVAKLKKKLKTLENKK